MITIVILLTSVPMLNAHQLLALQGRSMDEHLLLRTVRVQTLDLQQGGMGFIWMDNQLRGMEIHPYHITQFQFQSQFKYSSKFKQKKHCSKFDLTLSSLNLECYFRGSYVALIFCRCFLSSMSPLFIYNSVSLNWHLLLWLWLS